MIPILQQYANFAERGKRDKALGHLPQLSLSGMGYQYLPA